MCDEEQSHRDVMQGSAALLIGRISRDLDHVAALFETFNAKRDAAMDAFVVLTRTADDVHGLMHRLDDEAMAYVNEEHVAAVLVEDATEGE